MYEEISYQGRLLTSSRMDPKTDKLPPVDVLKARLVECEARGWAAAAIALRRSLSRAPSS